MVRTCCVFGCTNNLSSKPKLSFFVVPKIHEKRGDNFEHNRSKKRRKKWMQALKWKNWSPNRGSVVCSVHFVQGYRNFLGKPAKLWDQKNVDWVPTLQLRINDTCKMTAAKASRNARYAQRKEMNNLQSGSEQMLVMDEDEIVPVESGEFIMPDHTEEEYIQHGARDVAVQTEYSTMCISKESQTTVKVQEEILFLKLANDSLRKEINHLQKALEDCRLENAAIPNTVREASLVREKHEEEKSLLLQQHKVEKLELVTNLVSTKTELSSLTANFNRCNLDLDIMSKQLNECKQLLENLRLDENGFKYNNDKLRYYTGLQAWATFEALFSLVGCYIKDGQKLTKFQRVLMFLMKLRLNCGDHDLAYRFQVSMTTVSRNFHHVLGVMYIRTKPLIIWPTRDTARMTMPAIFQKLFKKTVSIIDCSEIFIERPTDLLARGQVWSNYKHHSTIKFLIAITPQGTVSFVSSMWGGRTSDKYITKNCGLLDKLLPGDLVLADRGFNINDDAQLMLAEIRIPPFTKGKKQLSKKEVDCTRELSRVRIHVERVIGEIKQKYQILQSVLPITLLSNNCTFEDVATMIVNVCSALINLCPPIVPME